MGYLFDSSNLVTTGLPEGLLWDFWFDLSVVESVLTLCFLGLTLRLLSKIDWTLDKLSLITVIIFILAYICKRTLSDFFLVKTLGSFILAFVNSSAEDPNNHASPSVISGLLAEEGQRYLQIV